MRNTKKIFTPLAIALLSLHAATASATFYVSNTEVNGTISASSLTPETALNTLMYGEFNINLKVKPSIYIFLNTQWEGKTDYYLIGQPPGGGTTTYDETTHLFTFSGPAGMTHYIDCGTGCRTTQGFIGTFNLSFYIFGNSLTDITFVPNENYITLVSAYSASSDQWADLDSPSRLDLNYLGTVPLPATAWLLGSGLLGLAASSKRRVRATYR